MAVRFVLSNTTARHGINTKNGDGIAQFQVWSVNNDFQASAASGADPGIMYLPYRYCLSNE